jgi:hypothetical protein
MRETPVRKLEKRDWYGGIANQSGDIVAKDGERVNPPVVLEIRESVVRRVVSFSIQLWRQLLAGRVR